MGVTPDVVVIGAGFAGLSAATALADRGHHVLVLEARPTLGGRASTFTDPVTRQRMDNGQHALMGGCHETFRFLRRIGTESFVNLQRNLSIEIVDREGRASRLSCPPLPAPFHLAAGLLRWKAIGWTDRLAARRVLQEARRDRVPPDPRAETVRDWLVRLGQTPRLIELLWEPLAVSVLNQPIALAGAAPFAAVLRRIFTGSHRDAALGLSVRPLDETYAFPARTFVVARGGEVRTQAPARVSAGGAAGGVSVRVRDEAIDARAVVCAVPWYALEELFEDPPAALADTLTAARGTSASSIVTVNFWFDRPLTSGPFLGLPGRTMQWVFDTGPLAGDSVARLSMVSSGADRIVGLSNEEIVEVARKDLAGALPAARSAKAPRAVVVRERRATFSLAPGQPTRPGTATGVPGLFLAGDWIDTGLPATIESAVVSGHWAADAADAFLNS